MHVVGLSCPIASSVQKNPTPEKQMRRPLILAILAALVGAFHAPADAVKKVYKPWAAPTTTK